LIYFYVRLAKHEEQYALLEFGDAYGNYMKVTPGFIPRFQRITGKV
jgi:protein-S-isoprenylcysteine O-methyltransferase Ste14